MPALDGLRGLAVLAVMAYHLAPPSYTDGVHVDLFRFLAFGWAGVDLFFVLSGFLITGLLLDAKDGPHYFTSFYMRRTLRIFPLYYGLLFTIFIALPAFHVHAYDEVGRGQWLFWLYLVNIHDAFTPLQNHSLYHLWSLAVEEQFYLVWPLLVWGLGRRALLRTCWCCVLIAITSRVIFTLWLKMPAAAYTLTLCRFDSLAFGGIAALTVRWASASGAKTIWESPKLWTLLAVAVVLLVAFAPSVSLHDPWMMTLGLTVLAVFFTATVTIAATGGSVVSRWLSRRPLTTLGAYSYALYLLHPLIHSAIRKASERSSTRFPALQGHFGGWGVAAATFIVSFLSAAISWQIYESPFLRLKRFFR